MYIKSKNLPIFRETLRQLSYITKKKKHFKCIIFGWDYKPRQITFDRFAHLDSLNEVKLTKYIPI